MKAKIDEQLICIPPYISSTWEQVRFLQSDEDPTTHLFTLTIHLQDGKEVHIPHLDSSLIDIAFSAHMKFLENKEEPKAQTSSVDTPKSFGGLLQQLTGFSPLQLGDVPIRFGITGLEGMPGMEIVQHTLSQSQAPDMPAEVVERITTMLTTLTNGDLSGFPKPEPHCNCPHCQVARSLHKITKEPEPSSLDLPVADEELTFRDWDITKMGENLYTVTSPLDPQEHYNVFLGTPVGCTCGDSHCAHIKAVLYS